MTVSQYAFLLVASAAAANALGNNTNANHIFNAVLNSMRQWGSSLDHNGMSFFLTTVPAGTEFYHGTTSSTRINGTQWLAFEPEHALLFANPRRGPPPPGGDRRHRPPPLVVPYDEGHETPTKPVLANDHDVPPWQRNHPPRRPGPASRPPPASLDRDQKPLNPPPSSTAPPPQDYPHGYLHTYRTLHPLRLLYLDGQSAAKSTFGTLDTQDLILRPLAPSPSPQPGLPHSGPMDEAQRAADLCALASTVWDGDIDGFLRMEGGFEVILCDFEKHLGVKTISAVGQMSAAEARAARFGYYQAVAARYDGIGGGRVEVDYESMVMVFDHPDLLTWDEKGRPRVGNDSSLIEEVGEKVGQMVRGTSRMGQRERVNWQRVADMVVGRYAGKIESLTSGKKLGAFEELQAEVAEVMRPFVSADDRDGPREVERCATQFWPAGVSLHEHDLGSAAKAVREVASVVCHELNRASTAETYRAAVEIFQELKQWLGWTTWKRCRGCGVDEVCFLPIWPMGSEEDFEHPKCVDEAALHEKHNGYWSRPGPPPGKGRPGKPGQRGWHHY